MKKLFSFIIAVVGMLAFSGVTFAATATVYDALPSVSPDTSYPSQPFQAQQVYEFGDLIQLGGTNRILDSVTVTLSDYAPYARYTSDIRYSENSVYWTHPITLNVYNVVSGTPNTVGSLLGTVTQTINIPWRPVASDGCPVVYGDVQWKDANNVCRSGYAFNATFDLSSLNVTLPDNIIIGVAFNTQSYGQVPMTVDGPYNSLNVVVDNQTVNTGTDNIDSAFLDSTWDGAYYSSGTLGVFREDTGWAPNGTVALQVTANATTPSIDSQCKNNGWKNYIDGDGNTFKNQGACVSYVAKNSLVGKVTGDIQMSDPSQKMIFDAFDYGQNSAQDKGSVEYWNYDYPGVLHYTANVLCATVDKVSKTARFMFQVPELGNIYVVSYVSDLGTPGASTDTYGHNATGDLTLAKQWCETGGGSISSYTITDGNLVVHK